MIIDTHYHMILEVSAPDLAKGDTVMQILRLTRKIGKKIPVEEIVKRAAERWPDPDGEKLIASMEEAGVDFTCICHFDALPLGLTPEMVQSQNRIVGGIAQRYPGRVMALAGIDPRRPEAPDMLRQCLEEFGMGGLKYHPDHGYDPSGPESYKVLEVLQENNGVLLSHTGSLGPPSRPKFAAPMLLSDLALDFPDLKVIAAHMGAAEWRTWAMLAAHQPNLYGDLAMWDEIAFGDYELFCRELRDLLDYSDVSKVLFGTDSPIFSIIIPIKDWIQLIKDLPNNAPEGITFREEEVSAILGGNAAVLLGLEPGLEQVA